MSSEMKPSVKKLSKGLLDLKFMKKSKEKAKVLDEDEERQILYQDQLASLHNTADKVVLIDSHYDLMKYLPCRLSFGGANPSIEKLNAPKLSGLYVMKKEEEPIEEDVDITKEEMAEHYKSFNQNLSQKFNRNRKMIKNFSNNKRSNNFESQNEIHKRAKTFVDQNCEKKEKKFLKPQNMSI